MSNVQLAIIIRAIDQASAQLAKVKDSAAKMGGAIEQAGNRAKAALDRLNNAANKLGSLGTKMTMAITLPVLGAGAALAKFGMDAIESENLFEASMGAMAADARRWSEGLRQQLGLNAYEVRRTVGTFNVMFQSMGVGEQAAYDMAKGLTQLGHDMASFYNLNPEDAFLKLQAAISGEVEPLKRLGIVVNETTIEHWALTNGLITAGQQMSEAQKVLARYAVIMEQTSKAQGDLARTMDSPANQLRRLQAEVTQLATDWGMALMPAASAALAWLAEVGLPAVKRAIENAKTAWGEMSTESQRGILVMVALMVAGGPLMTAISAISRAVLGIGTAFNHAILKAMGLLTVFWLLGSGFEAAMTAINTGSFDKFEERFRSNMARLGTHVEMLATKGAALAMGDKELERTADRIFAIKERQHNLEAEMLTAQSALNRAAKTYAETNNKGLAYNQTAENALRQMRQLEDALATKKAEQVSLAQELETLASTLLPEAFGATTEAAGGIAEQIAKALGLAKTLQGVLAGGTEYKRTTKRQTGMVQGVYLDEVVEAVDKTNAGLNEDSELIERLKRLWAETAGVMASTGKTGAEAAKQLGPAINEIVDALVRMHPATQVVAAEVAMWQQRIDSVNLAIQANQDQLKAAQAEYSRMSERLSQLNEQLSAAKQRLSDLQNVQFVGEGAMGEQIYQLQRQILGLEIQKLKLPAGMDASAIDKQMEELRRQLELLQKEQEYTFGDMRRQLQKAAEGVKQEMTLDAALAAISQTKGEIDRLTRSVSAQEAAMKAQQNVINGIQAAADALNRTLQAYQANLAEAQRKQDLLTQALQLAYNWLLEDRTQFTELGAEGERVAGVMDIEARKLLAAVTDAATDTSTISADTLAAMIANYQTSMAEAIIAVRGVDGKGGLIGALNEIPDHIYTYHHTVMLPPEGYGIEGRAAGGPVYGGHPYVVGERGPELFVPSTGGHIVPNSGLGGAGQAIDYDKLAAALARQPIVVTIDGHEVMTVVRDTWRQTGARTGQGW